MRSARVLLALACIGSATAACARPAPPASPEQTEEWEEASRRKRRLGQDGPAGPSVGGEPRIARTRDELGYLAAQVPDTFSFEKESIAIVPGAGLPACCDASPAAGGSALEPAGSSEDRIEGTTLVAVFVFHAPGERSAFESGRWRTRRARLIRVPKSVDSVIVEEREGAPMP